MGRMNESEFPSGCSVAPVTPRRRSPVAFHTARARFRGGLSTVSRGAEPAGIPAAEGKISTWLLSAADEGGDSARISVLAGGAQPCRGLPFFWA